MPHAFLALAFGDLLDRAPAHRRQRHLLQHVRVLASARPVIVRLDKQPVLLRFFRPAAHAHEMPGALELLAIESEREAALLEPGVWIALRIPAPAVPDQHGAAAILALRDGAFELVVFDRVVLDADSEPLLAGNQARASRHRPALHHPLELEPQIVVQPAGGVLLDDVLIALGARLPPARLRRHVELALLAVDLQAHGSARPLELLALGGALRRRALVGRPAAPGTG